ncbi:hypothetical protein [Microbacterium sp. 2FI]|uniref:hypothetical protein n=1 Tax=Microbacterium sp. 2FI TaxID=2502193 RepID=UPI0010F8C910|nr:hypothetical protein [Microbacterium sp. 2FI]
MRSRALTGAVALLLLASALSACTPSPEPTEPTPLFASEAEAFAAAEETYRAYVDALNQVDLSDPATFEDVYAWTTGDLNRSDRQGLTTYHAEGTVVSGESSVALVEGSTANISRGTVDLAVCLDVSNIDVRDSDGNSVVDPDRTPVQSLVVSLSPSTYSPTALQIEAIGPRVDGPSCS